MKQTTCLKRSVLHLTALSLLCAATATAQICGGFGQSNPGQLTTDHAPFAVPVIVWPILGLQTPSGSTIHFLQESDRRDGTAVSVVESTPRGVRPQLPRMMQAGMTPWEVFRAVAGLQAEPPEALVEDHRRLARSRSDVPLAPRTVFLQPGHTYGRQVHFETVGCYGYTAESDGYWNGTGYFNEFLDDVADAFGEELSHNSGLLQTSDSSLEGSTGFSTRRAIGVCNASGADKMVHIERRTSECTWETVPMNFSDYDGVLTEWQGLFYYSDSGSLGQQFRVRVFGVDGPPDFGNQDMTYMGLAW